MKETDSTGSEKNTAPARITPKRIGWIALNVMLPAWEVSSLTRHAGKNVSRLWQRLREVTAERIGGTGWLRVGCVITVLMLLSVTGFVQALATSYRLWQLTEKRVSVEENGSFHAFLQETRWCRQVISGGLL